MFPPSGVNSTGAIAFKILESATCRNQHCCELHLEGGEVQFSVGGSERDHIHIHLSI